LAQLGKKVISFEPAVSNFNALRINLILNNLEDHVTAYNLALGDQRQQADFAFDQTNTGASHKVGIELDTYPTDQEEIFNTTIVPLDELIEEMDIAPDARIFMKVDVEGMEEQVLIGARQFLKKYPHITLVMESVHSGKEKLSKVLNQIDSFDILDVDDLNMGARKREPQH
jgi:FkbM family methyltransferase